MTSTFANTSVITLRMASQPEVVLGQKSAFREFRRIGPEKPVSAH